MALDITTLDIVVDESTGLTDNDVATNVAPHNTDNNAIVQYLLGLDAAGGLSSPEVAFKADFVTASATGTDTFSGVSLSQSLSGTPFSTTVGVNSGIQTVDGNYVWLFLDPNNANVVRGVIGTSDANAEPAEGGALAFSFALINTNTATPDLYLVQYVALSHPNPALTDERIDLTNKVFASLSATTTVGFSGADAAPGNNDFYVINSPTDASKQILVIGLNGGTANVSTQGFGVDNQSINPGETLQVDFVTGGNLAAGSASEIQYGSHLENVTQAGFTINQITPSQPAKRVDISITASNNTGNDQGTNFFDGTATTAVDITSVKLTGTSGFASVITADGTYATASGNVTVSGLTGTGNVVTITGLDNVTTVDITTASPVDRLQISGVDANEGCDITEFHFQTTTPNGRTEEVGSFINFDDSGPSLSITAVPLVGAAAVVEASGAGGQSQVSITAPAFSASAVDGVTSNVTYALSLVGPTATGLQTTAGNKAISLVVDSATSISGKYDSDANGSLDATAFTVTLSGTTVTLTSLVALEHSNAPQGAGEDNTLDLNGLINVVATVSGADGDNDPFSQQSTSLALSLTFNDTDPSLSITAPPTVGAAAVGEASGAGGQSQVSITPPSFSASAVDGTTTNTTYALALAGGTATGLQTTAGNKAISLVVDSVSSISGKYDSDGNGSLDATAFTVTLSGTTVTLTSLVALEHSNAPQGAGEDNTLDLNGLINVVATVTVTDGDSDVVSQQSATSGALSLTFNDTDPTLTKPFDADPVAGGIQTPETLANTAGATASGAFGYAMTDQVAGTAYNLTTVSDFVDVDLVTAGVQIALTGTVDNAQNPGITQAVATLTAETASSATFDFSFHYDKDPITAGVQDATAGGTLAFDKVNDTYTLTLNDVIDGFSFDILQTSGLVAKAPAGNTGHPQIVAEQLTENDDPDPFFVQFTGNSTTQQIAFGFNSTGDGAAVGDTTFNNGGATHDMVTNTNEDWVSATQATNGVAGDTIQKGEVLTLRFFGLNILPDVNPAAAGGGNERLDPTALASAVVVEFDGIGTSEDLIVILDLKDANGVEITRAINVQNSDLIKGNANVPSQYNTFTLDNNDALLIIEQNDYNAAGETYQIQGVQIMQSGNGLTGSGINLNGAIGANGGSNATGSLTAWDATDNDVLKIVDIGFVQSNSGTIGANLNFAFDIQDGDGDLLGVQNIPVQVGTVERGHIGGAIEQFFHEECGVRERQRHGAFIPVELVRHRFDEPAQHHVSVRRLHALTLMRR